MKVSTITYWHVDSSFEASSSCFFHSLAQNQTCCDTITLQTQSAGTKDDNTGYKIVTVWNIPLFVPVLVAGIVLKYR